jgi:hypothetical protein
MDGCRRCRVYLTLGFLRDSHKVHVGLEQVDKFI